MSHNEPIRNPALASALAQAAVGSSGPLYAVLARLSGLPGTRPNWRLAEAVGAHIAGLGATAPNIVAALCRPSPEHDANPAAPFFRICGAMALSALELKAGDWPEHQGGSTLPEAGRRCSPGEPLEELRELADDIRLLVREGVVHALVHLGEVRGDALVGTLAPWMSGYMSASVALEAIGNRALLDKLRLAAPVVARLDEAFELAERAPRADQRSQGFRLLLRALSEVPMACIARFPTEVEGWLEQRAAVQDPELRACVQALLGRSYREGRPGHEMRRVAKKLSDTAPPRRDPRTYVGPTRRRGSRGRGES